MGIKNKLRKIENQLFGRKNLLYEYKAWEWDLCQTYPEAHEAAIEVAIKHPNAGNTIIDLIQCKKPPQIQIKGNKVSALRC